MRENDNFKLGINNDFIFEKEINFSIQKNESENARNETLSSYHANFGLNCYQKSFGESLDNLNAKENNKINIISDDKKANLLNMSSISKNFSNKKIYFNVIKNNDELLFDTNNEIKVLKNKKAVFVNRYLLNSYSTSRSLKKFKKFKFEIKKKTSSKFRGVSKNGNKWQVLIMINNTKYYMGSYISEEIAARVYDIFAIKYRGINARTNYIYNHIQIKRINESKINIKSGNISDIIEKLIN